MKHDDIERIMEYLALVGEDVSPVSKARVVSCIVYKKQIISIGTSQYKTHPFQTKYSKNEHAVFLHAEVDAIYKSKRYLSEKQMKKAFIFVCRPKIDALTGISTYGISRPCDGCYRCIMDHNLRGVYYTNTTSDGSLSYTHRRY